jgi:carboxyl-terminal processing protease
MTIKTTHVRRLLAVCALGALAVPGFAGDDPVLEDWSRRVWSSAMSGDAAELERELAKVPEARSADLDRIRQRIQLRNDYIARTAAERKDQYDEALRELNEHLAEDDLSEALISAVRAQTHTANLSDALSDPDIKLLIADAEREAARAEDASDWLLAQELLFRLRTLHEDTNDYAAFGKFDGRLDRVNRRIGLLAQYAPREFHEMRRRRALEVDPDAKFPEYNERFAEDWKDRLDDISQPILRSALSTVASEHIEGGGWQPLLAGGLEALKIVGTTSLLGTNFPGLADPDRVREWTSQIEALGREVSAAGFRGSLSDYNRIITKARTLNDRTIQIPDAMLLREFGDGAMYRLDHGFGDEYSEIIWPDRMRRFKQQTEGNFVGVGILIRHNDMREIIIIQPLEGSPAHRSGVKANDKIVQVDGEYTDGWSLNDAVDNITGPRGQQVTLGVTREGSDDVIQIPVKRDRIKIRSVNGWYKKSLDAVTGEPQWDWYVDRAAGIGYIRMTAFNEDTFNDLLTALQDMDAERPLNGLVLDLRYNPGGLLKCAVQVSNLFVKNGTIVYGQNRGGREAWRLRADSRSAPLAGLPTVVLVNKGSASASEIVAGCLQAHDAAVIVGSRSFGKGSVQTVHSLGEIALLKLTTQHYVLPNDRLVHKKAGAASWGVDPDLVVEMTPEQIEAALELRQAADIVPEPGDADERPNVSDLLTKGIDPQLDMALLVLQARALAPSDQRLARN